MIKKRPPMPVSPSPLTAAVPAPPTPPRASTRIALSPAAAASEVELKLAVAPEDLPRLAALPLITSMAATPEGGGPEGEGAGRTRRQVTTYYDTAGLTLARQGLAVRRRQDGDRVVQTVKTMASDVSAGAAVRREWEWPLPADGAGCDADSGLDLAGLRRLDGLPPLPDGCLDQLAPVFTTDITRTAFTLHPDPRTTVELALDHGEVVAGAGGGGRKQRIAVAELELELVSGRVATLYALAAALHRHVPLRLTARSKADAGLALLTGRRPQATPAPALVLTPAVTMADALRHVLRQGITHLLANADTVRDSGDRDAVEQMALAARCLHQTLRLFHKTTGNLDAADLARRIKRLRRSVEEARRLVRLVRDLPRLLSGPSRKRSAPRLPVTRWGKSGDRAIRHLRRRLDRRPFTALILDLALWVESGGWCDASLERPLRPHLPPLLDRLHRACLRAGRDVGRPGGAGLAALDRHAARLAALAEAAQGLYPGGGPWLTALRAVRTILGDALILREATAPRDGALRRREGRNGRAVTPGLLRTADHRLKRDLAVAWGRLTAIPPFWPPPAALPAPQ